jgi:hypothetical protein
MFFPKNNAIILVQKKGYYGQKIMSFEIIGTKN